MYLRNSILLVVLMLLVVSCGQREISRDKLQYRNGVAYAINEEEPYSGKANSRGGGYTGPSESIFENGKLHGPYIFWYRNGQKWKEGTFYYAHPYYAMDSDGLCTEWHENGQMKSQRTYKEGVRHGTSKGWSENGRLIYNDTYKNGIKVE